MPASTSAEAIHLEHEYLCHNYHPLPVVFAKAEGVNVWDPEGRKYIDCLSCYSAVNQGHRHPKIIGALIEQAGRCTLSSRAFYNDRLGEAGKKICEVFGYESCLLMNSGAEGVESALKIARNWGYVVKGIPKNEAIIICAKGNFHGRTISIITMSTDPDCTENFGPFLPGFENIDYDAPEQLEALLKEKGDRVCAFIQEPIQGEAGVYVPSEGYLTRCQALCKQYNCLYIDDEIQTGIARTGRMLAADHENVRPDVVILGKAISGGAYPVSVVLCDKHIMDVIKPGTHGSTFGGCPMACAVSIAALEVIEEEKLIDAAQVMGERMRKGLRDVPSDIVKLVRGKGLLNAVVVERMAGLDEYTAYAVCLLMAEHGVLAKPTHSDIIRLAPPLTVTEADVDEIVRVFHLAVKEAPSYAGRLSELPRWDF